MQAETTRIHLYGALRKYCNNTPYVDMYAPTLRIAVQALASRFGDGVKDLIKNNNWQIYTKKYTGVKCEKHSLSEGDVDKKLSTKSLHFYPKVEGSGKAGRIIAGIILVVVGIVYGYFTQDWANATQLILAGVGMILGALFMPNDPKMREKADERPSFVFNQATNTIEQGGAVPLVYGRFRTGSTVVSTGLDAERLATYTSPTGENTAPDEYFWTRDPE